MEADDLQVTQPSGQQESSPLMDTDSVSDLDELRDSMRTFTAERGWERFHDPKSLLLALVGEVGELTELFQWLPANEAAELAQHEPLRTRAGEELADVLMYLVRLADILDIDLRVAADRKRLLNAEKHVVRSAREHAQPPLGRRSGSTHPIEEGSPQ